MPGAPPPPPMLVAPRLLEAVQARLDLHEQSIIFLNRRGYASSLQCPQCGHVEMCPNCSISPTYHRQAGRLICHLCDFTKAAPPACPECGFSPYTYTGSGTERIEQALAEAFPKANLVRMDSDTMRGKNAYERTLGDFAAGRIDILVGTQMIAKGLHFPRVTCVGVINADLALQIPDFRASERVFQLLMQVSGRSGRGLLPGEVFVQTRAPFHPAIQFARHHDYLGFAEQELEFRRSLHYPPYERFILVAARGRNEEKTRFVLEQLAKEMEKLPGCRADRPGARAHRAHRRALPLSGFPAHEADHCADAAAAPDGDGKIVARRRAGHGRCRSGQFALREEHASAKPPLGERRLPTDTARFGTIHSASRRTMAVRFFKFLIALALLPLLAGEVWTLIELARLTAPAGPVARDVVRQPRGRDSSPGWRSSRCCRARCGSTCSGTSSPMRSRPCSRAER